MEELNEVYYSKFSEEEKSLAKILLRQNVLIIDGKLIAIIGKAALKINEKGEAIFLKKAISIIDLI